MILLRVEMLDIPGALANAAAAIASTGTDMASIRIVGRTDDDTVVDDFICELAPDVLPDSLVSAFAGSTGANVLWISRCPAQWDLLTESDLAVRWPATTRAPANCSSATHRDSSTVSGPRSSGRKTAQSWPPTRMRPS